jgi:hypothetical protein
MATFTSQIFEILTLNGDNVGSSVTQTINNINYVDNRILSVPTGSVTTLFTMDSVPGAGAFVTSSIQYVRVTNNSTITPVKLILESTFVNTASFTFNSASVANLVQPTGSFIINGITIAITGSPAPINTATTIFIPSGSSPADTITAVVTAFNVSKSIYPYDTPLQYITSSISSSTGIFFNTVNPIGVVGNSYYLTSGSITTNFTGGLGANEAMSYLIATGSSYMLSTSKMTGSTSGLSFNDIKSVKVQPSSSAASIEYYIVTT